MPHSWAGNHTNTKVFYLSTYKIPTVPALRWTGASALTSEDGRDDGGQQTAGVDGQVEDGEEGASLLLLLENRK